MVSVSEKITEEFLAKLKAGSDVRPDQIARLEKLLKQPKSPKSEDIIAVLTSNPTAVAADKGEAK